MKRIEKTCVRGTMMLGGILIIVFLSGCPNDNGAVDIAMAEMLAVDQGCGENGIPPCVAGVISGIFEPACAAGALPRSIVYVQTSDLITVGFAAIPQGNCTVTVRGAGEVVEINESNRAMRFSNPGVITLALDCDEAGGEPCSVAWAVAE